MEDEGKLNEQYERGERAKRLCNDGLIQEFFENYERMIWNTFKKSDLTDDEGQKNCRLHMKVLEDFKQHFQTLMANGQYAGEKLVEGRKKGLFNR